jgi:hypothetical protein
MNASGRLNTCKSNEVVTLSGARVRNTYATYLSLGDNLWKQGLIPHKTALLHSNTVKVPATIDGHASD